MKIGQWLVLSIMAFTLFLFFVFMTHSISPKAVPLDSSNIGEWIWWSSLSIKKSIYYSLSMIFFFISIGFAICGLLQDKERIEHMKV
ncbi:hypothetical protein ACFLRF_00965 [Candidatus Altiarchaeota archaeon]